MNLSASFQSFDDAACDDTADVACRLALLELIEIEVTLARRVREQAEAPEAGPQQVGEAVAAFDRVSRAVRRTVRMVRWLDETPRQARTAERVLARKRIIRAVEDRIDRVADAAEADELHGELLERLDAPDLDEDIAGRPAAEIIGEICRDLGLDRWPEAAPSLRRRPADVAALHRRAEAMAGETRGVVAPDLPLARGSATRRIVAGRGWMRCRIARWTLWMGDDVGLVR